MSRLRSSLTPLSAALSSPFKNSLCSWSKRESLLLQVHDEQGRTGSGEAAPLPGYSPDSLSECQLALSALPLFPRADLSLPRIEECIAEIPSKLPAARFALETALLDLLAQERECSLSALLGATSTRTSRSGLIDHDAASASVATLMKRGIDSAKLKVGKDWDRELATITSLRKEFPNFRLRLDANGAWSTDQALENLQCLLDLKIDFVEQPVAPALMPQLAGASQAIAADESMHTELGREALAPLLTGSALVAIVLKPTVLGGMLACMKHRAWAAEQGVASVVSHCFEGPVGTAAVAELAIAVDGPFAAGVDHHDALALLPDALIPQLQSEGLRAHRPGHGVVVATSEER